MEHIYSIYKITNKITNKSYIGYSQNYKSRWKSYQKIKPNRSYKRYIERSISKEGLDNFIFEVIYQSLDKAHTLCEMEQHFINEYNTMIPNGYNMVKGGRYIAPYRAHLKDTKQRLSALTKLQWKDPVFRENVLSAIRGRVQSEEEKLKRATACKLSLTVKEKNKMIGLNKKDRVKLKGLTEKELNGYKKTAEKLKGRPLTEEHKAKISMTNHSNVRWTVSFNNETFTITDNINNWAKSFGISHNILFDALKRTNSQQNYKDKSVAISGTIKRGKFAGMQITRSPII